MHNQIVIVGGGAAGLAAALALARLGCESTVITGRSPAMADNRTAALFTGSIELLRNLGAWEACRAAAAPIEAIQILDATHRGVRAPDAFFRASDLGLDAFGYNVPNHALTGALGDAATADPRVELVPDQMVASLAPGAEQVRMRLEDGRELTPRLVLAADGRNSPCRAAAGIAVEQTRYEQAALTCTFTHARRHRGVSTEFHRASGPLTTVPLPGNRSSLVWVDTPGEAKRLSLLGDAEFAAELGRHLGGLLGDLSELTRRAVFPLSLLTANPLARNRIMLIGEAGHVIPPIGAQGLNLGLRDAATAAECVASVTRRGDDPGSEATLQTYVGLRGADVHQRSAAVDLMNRSLLAPYLPVHLLRGAGLAALSAIPPLRRLVMRHGLQPATGIPELMRQKGAGTAP